MKAENRRLREDVEILRGQQLSSGNSPPQPLIMGFIDTMRSQGHAVESICRVLREQGCQVPARTYRPWKRSGRVVAVRTVADAQVVDAVRDIAWTTKADSDGVLVRKLSPEGLCGRRKMTAYLRRTAVPGASAGSVDRAMRTLGLSGVQCDKDIRTTIPAKDGFRAQECAPARAEAQSTSSTESSSVQAQPISQYTNPQFERPAATLQPA